MRNNKQTAVEWLEKELKDCNRYREEGIFFIKIPEGIMINIIEQAKEMEKQQKELEFDKGWSKGWDEAVKEYEKNR